LSKSKAEKKMADPDLEFVDEDDTVLDPNEAAAFSDAVLYSADWTVETIISQLKIRNIDRNPRFQRRDAWSSRGKGRFIESVILGFPIPQIVLAEKKRHKGAIHHFRWQGKAFDITTIYGKRCG
jgi:hypothetical protein